MCFAGAILTRVRIMIRVLIFRTQPADMAVGFFSGALGIEVDLAVLPAGNKGFGVDRYGLCVGNIRNRIIWECGFGGVVVWHRVILQ